MWFGSMNVVYYIYNAYMRVMGLNDALIICVPFPYGVQGRMWNSIVSVADHYLLIYF